MNRAGGWSWGALGASVAFHGAALVTTLGHPSAGGPNAVAPAPEPVQIETEPEEIAVPAPVDRGAEAPAHAGHTHPYPVPPSHDWTPHDPSLVHVFTTTPAEPAAPAEPVDNAPPATEALPRFTIAIGTTGSPSSGGPASASSAPASGDGQAGEGGGIESERTVSTPARLLRGVSPRYPIEARAQAVEADVPLEVVVSADGAVESARALGHAAYGFDAAALEAIRQYRFAPATRAGHSVRVRMRWTMEFRLR